MSTPTAGGSYTRQPDGTLKRIEETAQLGSEKHEAAAAAAAAVANETTKPARGAAKGVSRDA